MFRLGLDIGGTLIKLVLIYKEEKDSQFQTKIFKIEETIKVEDFLKQLKKDPNFEWIFDLEKNDEKNDEKNNEKNVHLTGGGSIKYKNLLETYFEKNILFLDEISCLIKGIRYGVINFPNEIFQFSIQKNMKIFIENFLFEEPFIVVNFGSGVSLIKVNQGKVERIDGEGVGGATFLGLTRILCGVDSYEEICSIVNSSEKNNIDSKRIHLVVGDIFGSDYSAIGLNAEIVASWFGKMAVTNDWNNKQNWTTRNADVIEGILKMVCWNISHIAVLNGKIYNISKFIFTGAFVNDKLKTYHYIVDSLNYWSKGQHQAFFLNHGAYYCALGAAISDLENDQNN
ncbi:pantothenate kinase 4 [Anaeramoeba ignava]|uniref:Pantothenate kinase 4 n=1 Tax=Anaeramoeba ignava TaxID=1746090 RepID=A0A9Q0LQN5_ANAIG|nr:pantothenate kinase 4 [Anaeramoeba ignava]